MTWVDRVPEPHKFEASPHTLYMGQPACIRCDMPAPHDIHNVRDDHRKDEARTLRAAAREAELQINHYLQMSPRDVSRWLRTLADKVESGGVEL